MENNQTGISPLDHCSAVRRLSSPGSAHQKRKQNQTFNQPVNQPVNQPIKTKMGISPKGKGNNEQPRFCIQ
jgi:hypothetical protein